MSTAGAATTGSTGSTGSAAPPPPPLEDRKASPGPLPESPTLVRGHLVDVRSGQGGAWIDAGDNCVDREDLGPLGWRDREYDPEPLPNPGENVSRRHREPRPLHPSGARKVPIDHVRVRLEHIRPAVVRRDPRAEPAPLAAHMGERLNHRVPWRSFSVSCAAGLTDARMSLISVISCLPSLDRTIGPPSPGAPSIRFRVVDVSFFSAA